MEYASVLLSYIPIVGIKEKYMEEYTKVASKSSLFTLSQKFVGHIIFQINVKK